MQLIETIQAFSFTGKEVRTMDKNGDPWFNALDVCSILEHSNHKVAVQSLDEDERGKFNLPSVGKTWFINESGLYHLIFKSRKPQARAFRRWVTSEVLPTLRQQGSYQLQGDTRQLARDYRRALDQVPRLLMGSVSYYHLGALGRMAGVIHSRAHRWAQDLTGAILLQGPALKHTGWYIPSSSIGDFLSQRHTEKAMLLRIAHQACAHGTL